ncbi:MAG: helix-turn-helix transcriptional regulator [Lachnospiraceae bacterium]|nr:helix-turn-helix transcriptional regulator [Lachnospiraceae bacterium]
MYFDPKSSGARIKKLRTAHGLTQEQFSQNLNISDSHLRKVESGVNE